MLILKNAVKTKVFAAFFVTFKRTFKCNSFFLGKALFLVLHFVTFKCTINCNKLSNGRKGKGHEETVQLFGSGVLIGMRLYFRV